MNLSKLVALGTPSELKALMKGERTVEIHLERANKSVMEEAGRLVKALSVDIEGDYVIMRTAQPSGGMVNKLSNLFAKRKVVAREITVREPSLEDVFVYVTGDKYAAAKKE
ncbi:Uncharacterised protein [uncultured archaeon]|nr:Uncharacterised protein [uncultured archaeon]